MNVPFTTRCAALLGASGTPAIAGPCDSTGTPPAQLEHVIVIAMENKDLGAVTGGSAPYFRSLVDQCGSSKAFDDNMFSSNLPSLPHYLGLTSGSNCDTGIGRDGSNCITSDTGPDRQQLRTTSIFEQVSSWRAYMEDMPRACDGGNPAPGTHYAAKHNPPAYYARLNDSCRENDVPIARVDCPADRNRTCSTPTNRFVDDLAQDRLAELSFVMPDLENCMHSGSVSQGDNWLHTYLPLIFDSPAYRRGGTVVYVVWDEQGSFDEGPTPNLFLSPFVGHQVSDVRMNLFAVLRAIEDQLGVGYLGCAGGSPPGGVGACPPGSTADLRSIFGI